jgi:Flp pilus assembly protein TadB
MLNKRHCPPAKGLKSGRHCPLNSLLVLVLVLVLVLIVVVVATAATTTAAVVVVVLVVLVDPRKKGREDEGVLPANANLLIPSVPGKPLF